MKKLKMLLVSVLVVVGAMLMLNTNQAFAADKVLEIQQTRPYSDDNGISGNNDERYDLLRLSKTFHVVKIFETGTAPSYPDAIYCLRAGLGFGADGVTSGQVTYTSVGDMITNRLAVETKYNSILKSHTGDSSFVIGDNYNSILWLIENMYLPKHANSAELKANLLADAQISESSSLTDDDIEVIQQIALWQITNEDQSANGNSVYLQDSEDLYSALRINGNNIDSARKNDIDKLFDYLVNTARTKTSAPSAVTAPTVSIKKNSGSVIKPINIYPVDFYLVGPFELTSTGDISKVDFDLSGILEYKYGTQTDQIDLESRELALLNAVFISDANGAKKNKTLQEMIDNGQFYIAVNRELYDENIQEFKFKIDYNYSYWKLSKADFYVAKTDENQNQPVVIVDKQKVADNGSDNITIGNVSGRFNLEINKVDESGNLITSDEARFTLKRMPDGTRTPYYTTVNNQQTGEVNGKVELKDIEIKSDGEVFTYEIEETNAPEDYIGIKDPFYIKVTTEKDTINNVYKVKDVKIVNDSGVEVTVDGVTATVSSDKTTVIVTVKNKEMQEYDLSLRKFITEVDGTVLTGTSKDREPKVDTSKLEDKTKMTATYSHSKTPIAVKEGDVVKYTIRVYNESKLDGKALEVTDYLPEGLEFIDPSESTVNSTYRWTANGQKITTDYLKDTTIKAFDSAKKSASSGEKWQKATTGTSGLYYADLEIECKVVAKEATTNVNLRNIAEITADDGEDRDSTPKDVNLDNYTPPANNSEYQEDDDDYEDLYIPAKAFDLALRKFITKVNSKVLSGEESRVPELDLTNLRDKSYINTSATYNHTKDPVLVRQGDIVTYTIRVYNEGDLDGYAKEVTDYLPEGLGLIKDYKTNFDNGWKLPSTLPDTSEVINLVGTDGLYTDISKVKNLKVEDFEGITDLKDVQIIAGKVPITTNLLQKDSLDEKINLIKGYNSSTKQSDVSSDDNWQKTSEAGKEDGLYYRDVEVTCIVLAENTYPDVIKNIAEVTDDQDEDGNPVDDRDSIPGNVDNRNEDDDDYEQLILKYFDLALRKFITGVNEKEVTTRVPEVNVDNEGKIVYTHTKEPVFVANSDVVTYTLRVYNEGTIEGYAEEVKDDIPEGLEFLPNHSTNKKYEWKMYYKDESGMLVETTDSKKATVIKTDYLSQAKETSERLNKINAFKQHEGISDSEPLNPDYKDIKAAFKVIEPNTKTDRIIINTAEISEDSGDDEDSIPNNDKNGEDDLDKEYIYVGYFDLELVKYVSKAIVTVDGKTTTTKYTMPKDDPGSEYLVKVVLDKNKIKNATVKFAYKIKVTNTGEIDGYATEITDYIPKGLTFEKKDNPLWEKVGTNKVSTRALEKTLLKPGESAEVEIVLTWKKSGENLGIKTNIAEISEDYNENGAKDIDSTPGNKVPEEDDQDFAKVILERSTGGTFIYIPVIGAIMLILSGGLVLIKRYVI